MGLFDNFDLGDFNFGNYGNDNPYDTNPFPMEDFRTAQIAPMLNQGNSSTDTIPDVMRQIGSGVQQDPTLNRYLSLANQGPPRREDYEPSTGRKILAAVGGLGYLFSDPRNAAKNVDIILDHPYDEAMGQYKNDLSVASDAAKQEGSLLNTGTSIFRDIAQEKNYASMADNRQGNLDYKYAGLDSREKIASAKLDLAKRQQDLIDAYHNKQISVQEYNSATQRMNAERQQLESPSLIGGRESNMALDQARIDALNRGPISGSRSSGPSVRPPNEAHIAGQLYRSMTADPMFTKYLKPDGSFNYQAIQNDPEASMAYRRLVNQAADQPFQRNEFDLSSIFNSPGAQ
jgi:hypothetical protein